MVCNTSTPPSSPISRSITQHHPLPLIILLIHFISLPMQGAHIHRGQRGVRVCCVMGMIHHLLSFLFFSFSFPPSLSFFSSLFHVINFFSDSKDLGMKTWQSLQRGMQPHRYFITPIPPPPTIPLLHHDAVMIDV